MENTIAIQRLTLNVCYKKKEYNGFSLLIHLISFLIFSVFAGTFLDQKICILHDFYLSKT